MITMIIAAGIIGIIFLVFKLFGIAVIVTTHCIKSFLQGYRQGIKGDIETEATADSKPPTVSEALKESASDRWKAYKEKMDLPYYIRDQLEALEAAIENIYIRLSELEEERKYTFNQSRLIEIDKKTASLKYEAAKKAESIEKIIAKYRA